MRALLIGFCFLGCIIQYWRSLAARGFGLGEVDAPPIVASPVGHLVVFALGFALKWGSAAALYRMDGLWLSVAVLVGATVLAHEAVNRFCRSDIENAARVQKQIDKGEIQT